MRPKLFRRTPSQRCFGPLRSALALAMLASVALTPALAAPAGEKTFGDWHFGCAPIDEKAGAKAGEVCQMFQPVLDKKAGKTVLAMIVSRLPREEKPIMEIVVPLGVRLVPGMMIRVDGSKDSIHVPFIVCRPGGCSTQGPLSDEATDRFKNGQKLDVSFISPVGRQVTREVSLSGFSAAFAALTAKH